MLLGPSWMMVLLLKQVHLQKDGGAEVKVNFDGRVMSERDGTYQLTRRHL